jgi:hypothetical protein
MATVDKLIVTNRSALANKYGSARSRIDEALKALVAADAERGVATRVVALDDAATLGRYRAKPVASPKDEPGCKAAIDRLVGELTPDYLMILGARDVVPHQRLRNTKHDGDPGVPSDLPYACDEPWNRDPRVFLTPTRVVGRLPDVTGATDPTYLVALLRRAARYRCRPRDDYQTFFGLSALAWQESTELSVKNLFGASDGVHTSPPEGPSWPRAALERRVHFINCHGGASDPKFYGQHPTREKDQPDAMSARQLERIRAVREGAVVAAECCYGADLYDPKEASAASVTSIWRRAATASWAAPRRPTVRRTGTAKPICSASTSSNACCGARRSDGRRSRRGSASSSPAARCSRKTSRRSPSSCCSGIPPYNPSSARPTGWPPARPIMPRWATPPAGRSSASRGAPGSCGTAR